MVDRNNYVVYCITSGLVLLESQDSIAKVIINFSVKGTLQHLTCPLLTVGDDQMLLLHKLPSGEVYIFVSQTQFVKLRTRSTQVYRVNSGNLSNLY